MINVGAINKKVYKLLGVIQNWNLIKGTSNWVSVSLTKSDNPLDSDHFAFGFETKNLKYLVNFAFLLLKEKAKLINFKDFEINSFLLSLRIQILKSCD